MCAKLKTAPAAELPAVSIGKISQRIKQLRRTIQAREISNFTLLIEGIDQDGNPFTHHFTLEDYPGQGQLVTSAISVLAEMLNYNAILHLKKYPK